MFIPMQYYAFIYLPVFLFFGWITVFGHNRREIRQGISS